MTKIRFPLAVAVVAFATTAMAQVQTLPADHNGSAMKIERDGARIRISYETPRPGLIEAGVRSGMVVFEGTLSGDALAGKAFAFKRGCSPAAYDVAGRIEGDRIALAGPGPKRQGCAVVALDPASPHSSLSFNGRSGTVAALSEDASRPRTGIEMRAAISPTPPPMASQPIQSEPAKAVPNPLPPTVAPAPVPVDPSPSAPVPMQRAEPVETARPVTPPVPVQAASPVAEPPRAAPTLSPTPVSPPPVQAVEKPKPKPKLDADL